MPKTKRDKIVSLTKVKPKDKGAKDKLIDDIREAIGSSKHVYLLNIENDRNDLLKKVRVGLRPGRLFCGKNKVMALAMGTMPETECEDNLRVIAKRIEGSCGVLCTDMPLAEVNAVLEEQGKYVIHARFGSIASKTVTLIAGTSALRRFPHSSEPRLRTLGLPTILKEGVIHLLGDHTVCKEGDELNTDQANLLKQLDIPMVKFQVSVDARWSRPGETEVYEDAEM